MLISIEIMSLIMSYVTNLLFTIRHLSISLSRLELSVKHDLEVEDSRFSSVTDMPCTIPELSKLQSLNKLIINILSQRFGAFKV